MGIEVFGIAAGAVVAVPVLWRLIDKLINEFFKNSRELREADKASRTTIDNHIDHLTKAVADNTEAMADMLERSEKNQTETKESRKELRATLIENTKASTTQILTNQQMIKTLEKLEETVDRKL